MATMGERIKMLRDELGLTQGELGKMLGKSSRTIGDYEKNRTKPAVEKLHIMTQLFGVSMEFITGDSDARCTVAEAEKEHPDIRRIVAAAMNRKLLRLVLGRLTEIPDCDLETLLGVIEAFEVKASKQEK